jgi:hypothetical protein
LPSSFPIRILNAFSISFTSTTCLACPILLDLITITISDHEHKYYGASHHAAFTNPSSRHPSYQFSLRLISSQLQFCFVNNVPKHLTFATFSKDWLATFIRRHCPTVWWWHMNTHLSFICIYFCTNFLLASSTASVFFFIFSPDKLTSQHRPEAGVFHSVLISLWFLDLHNGLLYSKAGAQYSASEITRKWKEFIYTADWVVNVRLIHNMERRY